MKLNFKVGVSAPQARIVDRQIFAARKRGCRLGRNRIELQKNALKALESLIREQNCTPVGSWRFGPFGED